MLLIKMYQDRVTDGLQIFSGSDDGTFVIWDDKTGTSVMSSLEGHTSGVAAVAFSSNGSQIVIAPGDQTLWIWDAKTSVTIM
jgi:WD40 repeat protein